MDEIAKAVLVKLVLLEYINDAMGYLLNEISSVGILGGLSYEENWADGICLACVWPAHWIVTPTYIPNPIKDSYHPI